MMSGDTVSNIIAADDKESTEQALQCVLVEFDPQNPVGIGWTYDEQRDVFLPPRPFPSWVLNETTLIWEAPIPYPDNGGTYEWDEYSGGWSN